MTKVLSLLTAVAVLASALTSCATANEQTDYSVTSSSAKAEELLTTRGGESLSGKYVLSSGEEAASEYADLSSFTDDGYIVRRIGDETVILGKTEEGLDRGVRYYLNNFPASGDKTFTYGDGYKVKSLSIAGRDISEFSIRLAADADDCHKFAASELREYIGRACGFYPEIVTSDTDHMIVLEQVLAEDSRYEVLGDEGFTIEVKDNGDLYITGGRYRGCMYGVYEFLERFVGWRFMYDHDLTVIGAQSSRLPDCYENYEEAVFEYLYEADSINIPSDTNFTQTPSFAYRETYAVPGIDKIAPDYYAVKARDNGRIRDNSAYNGYGIASRAIHGILGSGLAGILPNYDGYDPALGGAQTTQPCFTDDGNIEVACDLYTTQIQSRIDAGQQIGREIIDVDVSHADNNNYCACKSCLNLYSLDKGHVGPKLYFTNAIADAVAEISPDIYVSMLAYAGANRPPAKTLPRDNVAVSYCYYVDNTKVSCFSHSYSGEDCMSAPNKNGNFTISNIEYGKELEGWCEIATRVIVWMYPGVWSALPFATSTVHTLLDSVRFMKEAGVYGFFVCPAYDSSPNNGILAYVLSKLFWNCDITDEEFEEIIKEYCFLEYGSGWENIYEYILLQERSQSDSCWSTFGFSDASKRINLDYYRENFDYLIGLYEEAALLADTSLQEYRIMYHSLTMYYTGLVATYNSMYKSGTDDEKALYLDRWEYFVEQFSSSVLVYGDSLALGPSDKPDPFAEFDITTTHPGTISRSTFAGGEWWDK